MGAIIINYNLAQYNMILHTLLQWLRQNMNQSFNPKKDPSYQGEVWSVFCGDLGEIGYIATALHCVHFEMTWEIAVYGLMGQTST